MADLTRRGLLAGAMAGITTLGLSACVPPQARYAPTGSGIVDVLVPYASGGGADTWARFMAPYLAEVLDGVSRFQIENVPGGESVTGTNAYVDAGVTSGQYLLAPSGTTFFNAVLERSNVEFEFSELVPLVINGMGSVLTANRDSGVRNVEDLLARGRDVTFGGISAAGLDLVPTLALEVLGGSMTSVFGFEGSGAARLARERGEIDLDFQSASTYLGQIVPLVEEEEAFPLFTVGMLDGGEVGRDPAMPDIPTLEDVYRSIHGTDPSGPAYDAYLALVRAGFFYQRGFWTNEGTSSEIVDAYAEAVTALNGDEQFLEDASSALGGYELLAGRDYRDQISDSLALSEETVNFVRDFIGREHDAVID